MNELQNTLSEENIEVFLKTVAESGNSSYKYLQNVYSNSDVKHQNVSLALAISEDVLGKNGVCRVHGGGFTVKEVVETARKVTGHQIPAREEERRAGDPSTLIASSDKAKSILGWDPKFADLETIIDTAWKWHQSHPHGYDNCNGLNYLPYE